MALASLYVFRMLGLFMVLPVLMLYGDSYRGSTPLLLGMALGAYGFSQALLQIPFGMLSDRWGRKPVIAAGLVIFAAGSVLAAMSESVYGLIAGRVLQGAGAIAAAVMALVTDLTADENRTKAMATIGASIGVSFALALVLGPVLAGIGGLSLIFWVTAGLALMGLGVLFWRVPKVAHTSARHEVQAVPALLGRTLRNVELVRLNVGIFTLHLVLMASFVVLPGVLEEMGVIRERHWWIYLPLLAGSFIAMLPLMILAEKRRQIKPVFVAAVLLLGVALAWLTWMPIGLPGLLLGLFAFFMAFNLLEAMLPSLVSRQAPVGAKGTATGIYSSSQFLGAFAGGAAGGALLQWQGEVVVWLLAVLMVGVWFVVALPMRQPRILVSMMVPLPPQSAADSLRARLLAQEGVEEVLVVESEDMIYLKLDPARVERARIRELVQQGS